MTLVEFLRARLTEDERKAMQVYRVDWDDPDGWANLHGLAREHAQHHPPARVLREVEAKRRIIRAHEKWCGGYCEATYPDVDVGPDAAYYWAMKVHASVYDQHPDYREEWRP